MIGLIGKKLGMTRTFQEDGRSVPVTVIQAGPCVVTQVKDLRRATATAPSSWVSAPRSPRTPPCPCRGISARQAPTLCGPCVEFRMDDAGHAFKLGQTVGVSVLTEVGAGRCDRRRPRARVSQGGIKRHGHHRGPAAHGSKNVRDPGSIGMHTFPGRVLPGKAMPGQMGNKQQTKKNLTVVADRPGAEPAAGQGQRARRHERNRFHPAQPLVAERVRRTGKENGRGKRHGNGKTLRR